MFVSKLAFLFAVATFSTSLYADYGSFWKGLRKINTHTHTERKIPNQIVFKLI